MKIRTDLLNAIVVTIAYWVARLAKGKQDHPTGEGQHKP